jgi:Family of unknown function (DUF6364)
MKSPVSTKLTLRLDSTLIHRAKDYALEQDRSLSQLVADYFSHLAAKPVSAGKGNTEATVASKPAPITAQLRGALRRPGVAAKRAKAPVSRADHRAHLEAKYL